MDQTNCNEERLRIENQLLQKKAAEAVHLRQQVLSLHHHLDQDSRRFEALQEFIRLAMLSATAEEFAKQVCESTIDLLECGVGMLWSLQRVQDQGCLLECGLGEISADQWHALKIWVDDWVETQVNSAGTRSALQSALELPPILRLHRNFLVELVLDSVGQPLFVIFACNTLHQMAFHLGFRDPDGKVFATYSRQVGVLVESLKRRTMIEQQNERIRTSEERLTMALAGGNVGLWDVDLAGKKVFYSEEWKQQIGYKGDEIGDSADEFDSRVHPMDLEMVRKEMQLLEKIGGRMRITFRMRHRNGTWRWIHSVGQGLSDKDGSMRRIIGIHIEVTEYKQMEAKLVKSEKIQSLARKQAERESMAKSSFLATVSHEIRTPLNGIMAAFQMLKLEKSDRPREKLLEIGENSGKWLLKIIGESLDLSRIEAGKVELVPEALNLRNLFDEMRFMAKPQASDKEIELRWDVSPDIPEWVVLDGGRLQQIFSNLLGNANKFTNKGFISFSANILEDGRNGRASVCFSVKDSGVGFSREFRSAVFQPFSQAAKRSESSHHGIGLGLGITRALVRLMGGKLKVWSRIGVGSRFDVILPMERLELSGQPLPAGLLTAGRRFKGTVLLAEDDQVSADLGKMMMEHLGLQVDLAKDGGEALKKAISNPYDLIVMDCWMPVKSGIEVTRELRLSSQKVGQFVPVIALTANAQASDMEECRQAGMNGFMTKPLFFGQLIEQIEQFLPEDPLK